MFTVEMVHSAQDATAYLESVEYDLIIMDWELGDQTGVEVCRKYRQKGGSAPILFLTGKKEVEDKMVGLDAGGDDYLTKPFHAGELVARVRALLRRPIKIDYKPLVVRDLELDSVNHTVKRNGEEIKLYPKEFLLLELFMRSPQRVFSGDYLLGKVWPTDSEASIETVRMTMVRLRQKVEVDPSNPLIRTIRGVGYRLDP
jgi:DNA-binding response OmpR family regulator